MSQNNMNSDIRNIATRLVELAKKNGAVDADALAVNDIGESISIRNGKVETVEREDSRGIGLRAFVETSEGLAFASASSSNLSDDGIKALAEQVLTMAKISAADPDAMPPSGADHPSEQELAEWESSHPLHESWTLESAKEAALACEAAALEQSGLIQNSEGADAGFGSTHVVYASADGFCGQYRKS